MSGESILVVEDNPINLKLIQVLLSRNGYQVTTAEDAEAALLILKNLHPALIVMDLQLPGMDGLQLTKFLKNDPNTSQIKILALTAYAMRGDEEKALSAGCDGYIAKPFDTRKLPELIAGYLNKK